MNKPDNLTDKGKAAGASLRKAAKQEERKIEAQKGKELRKGEKRFALHLSSRGRLGDDMPPRCISRFVMGNSVSSASDRDH